MLKYKNWLAANVIQCRMNFSSSPTLLKHMSSRMYIDLSVNLSRIVDVRHVTASAHAPPAENLLKPLVSLAQSSKSTFRYGSTKGLYAYLAVNVSINDQSGVNISFPAAIATAI